LHTAIAGDQIAIGIALATNNAERYREREKPRENGAKRSLCMRAMKQSRIPRSFRDETRAQRRLIRGNQ
jgi:hypothetical protein